MKIQDRGLTLKIFCTVLGATLLVWGCVPDRKAQPKNKTRAQAQKTKVRRPVRPSFKLEIPKLAKPEALAAAKVVHLVYTSNVDGELEPCG